MRKHVILFLLLTASLVVNAQDKAVKASNFKKTTYTVMGNGNLQLNMPKYNGEAQIRAEVISEDGADVICYEIITGAHFLLKDFLKHDSGYVGDADFLGFDKEVYWSKSTTGFRVFYEGAVLQASTNYFCGEDIIVFLPDINKTYKLEDFNNKGYGSLEVAENVTSGEQTYYFSANNDISVFRYGIALTKNIVFWYRENDLIVYDTIEQISYFLKDVKNIKAGKLYDAVVTKGKVNYIEEGLKSTICNHISDGTFNFTLASFLVGGELKSVTLTDGRVLAYEANNHATFILNSLKDEKPGYTCTPEYISNADVLFWQKKDEMYWLFYQGEEFSDDNIIFYCDKDIVLYTPKLNRTFRLVNFANENDGNLFPAMEITDNGSTYVYSDDEGVKLFSEELNLDVKHVIHTHYIVNDLILFDSTTTTTYLLKDYRNTSNCEITNKNIISTELLGFVYKFNSLENTATVILNGLVIESGYTIDTDPNDENAVIIVIGETGNSYKVSSFKNAELYKLLPMERL